jgi:FAD/FMN-containing dehydrogenase
MPSRTSSPPAIIPAGLEMMDKPMTAAVEDYVHAGYDVDAAAILLCESDGTPEEVAEEIARMEAVLGASGATRIEISQNEAQRLKFWSGRKNAFPATGRMSPDYMCMELSVEMGGTVSGEHGVGVEKLSAMCVQFSPGEREQMFAIKRAFDPSGLLNPGKVIPSLARCAEYGKMHVKRGLLPFAEIPRF